MTVRAPSMVRLVSATPGTGTTLRSLGGSGAGACPGPRAHARLRGGAAPAGATAPGGLDVENMGSRETRDATRTRVNGYVSTALFNTIKVAKLVGVRP